MACEDIKKLIDANERYITRINDLSKVQSKKTSAVKRIITGIASAMEGIGSEFELGISGGGASAKITLKPKHSRVAEGAIKAWEGWEEYQGKVPTLNSLLALLKQIRSNLLKEYEKCLKNYFWEGSITYTFTEEFSGRGDHRREIDHTYEEKQVWKTTEGPDDDDLQ
jgi:hypothetical protein